MFTLERLNTVADIDAAVAMAEKRRTDSTYRIDVLRNQITNAENSFDNLEDEKADRQHFLNGMIAQRSTLTGDTSMADRLIAEYQRTMTQLEDREANVGVLAIQNKNRQIALQEDVVALVDIYIQELNTKKATLAA